MGADGSDSASFTIKLVNQVTAPARAVQSAMAGVTQAMEKAQRSMAAPAPRRGMMSEWDKMTAAAKRSQTADFSKTQAAAEKARRAASGRIAQSHLDHGITTQLSEAGSEMAIAGTEALALAGVAAAATIGYLGVKFTEAAVEAGIFAQKSELAIGFLTNNAPAAAAQFDDVRHMAQTLGLQVDETVGSFERLLAMQFDVGKSKDLIKMAADMQAIGASGEEVQRILYAISEIKSMGTLQKRQERMLQMAGISGQLIDAALMKSGGYKDHGALEKARKGNKIGADVAIDAVMEAVMHKTHESALGDAGAAFASTTLAGMRAQMGAEFDNLLTDVGVKLLPGVTKIAHLFADIFNAIISDPAVMGFGQYMLDEFTKFTDWLGTNWTSIVAGAVTAAQYLAAGLKFMVGMFDSSTLQGKATIGVLETLALVMGVVALAGLVMMTPFYILIGVIGLLAYGIYKAVEWVVGAIESLGKWISLGGSDAATGAVNAAALPVVANPDNPLGATQAANDNTLQPPMASGAMAALSGMSNDKTENGQGAVGAGVVIHSMPVTVPQADDPQKQATLIGQEVKSQLASIIRQAS